MKSTKFNSNVDDFVKQLKSLKRLDNTKIRHSFDINRKTVILSFSVFNRRLVWTRGTSNRTIDGKFIPYFDYDNMKESYVRNELRVVQEQFELSDIMVFKSSENSYHGICLDRLPLKVLHQILGETSCDWAFKEFPKRLPFGRYYILRNFGKGNTGKPQYLYTLKGKSKNMKSLAHWKFFKALYPEIRLNKLDLSDEIEQLTIVDYPTGTNV